MNSSMVTEMYVFVRLPFISRIWQWQAPFLAGSLTYQLSCFPAFTCNVFYELTVRTVLYWDTNCSQSSCFLISWQQYKISNIENAKISFNNIMFFAKLLNFSRPKIKWHKIAITFKYLSYRNIFRKCSA